MNRRSLLCSSLAAAVSSYSSATAEKGAFKGIIRKAVKFPNIDEPRLSTTDKFRLLADLGFDGVELRHTHVGQEREFVAARDKTGLPVHGVVNSSEPDLIRALQFCADVGGDGVLIVAPYDRQRPLMDSWNEGVTRVREALPTAERLQVKLLIENVWAGFLISALDAERFIDEVDNPWFGSYFDVGNNARWGVPQHWIQVLGSRIGKLDIKEWDEKRHATEGLRKGFASPIGDGTIDWAAVRTALKEIQFSGWATAEVGDADRVRLADLAVRMDRVLDLA